MNTKIIDAIVKRNDDPNKKATFLNKVSTWAVVITFGVFTTIQKEQRIKKDK